jgi:hypothetical protein
MNRNRLARLERALTARTMTPDAMRAAVRAEYERLRLRGMQDVVTDGAATAERRASQHVEKEDASRPKSEGVFSNPPEVEASVAWARASTTPATARRSL